LGANVYRGDTFGTLFDDYRSRALTLAILEYGIDAYDNVNQVEYETIQADYAARLWEEIEANLDTCLEA